ncbi:hypothetical protein KAW38_02345 [Candidatus Micrarchaeota archaeon]|nr:hypothetical protein [Candidatus Micrarchaeota archaeon]
MINNIFSIMLVIFVLITAVALLYVAFVMDLSITEEDVEKIDFLKPIEFPPLEPEAAEEEEKKGEEEKEPEEEIPFEPQLEPAVLSRNAYECTLEQENSTTIAKVFGEKARFTISYTDSSAIEHIFIGSEQTSKNVIYTTEVAMNKFKPKHLAKCDWYQIDYNEIEEVLEELMLSEKFEVKDFGPHFRIEKQYELNYECFPGNFGDNLFIPEGDVCEVTYEIIKAIKDAEPYLKEIQKLGENPCTGLEIVEELRCEKAMGPFLEYW